MAIDQPHNVKSPMPGFRPAAPIGGGIQAPLSYQPFIRPPDHGLGRALQQLGQGLDQLAAALRQKEEGQNELARRAELSRLRSELVMDMEKIVTDLSAQPDLKPSDIPVMAGQKYTELVQNTLKNITDPKLKTYVEMEFNKLAPTFFGSVKAAAADYSTNLISRKLAELDEQHTADIRNNPTVDTFKRIISDREEVNKALLESMDTDTRVELERKGYFIKVEQGEKAYLSEKAYSLIREYLYPVPDLSQMPGPEQEGALETPQMVQERILKAKELLKDPTLNKYLTDQHVANIKGEITQLYKDLDAYWRQYRSTMAEMYRKEADWFIGQVIGLAEAWDGTPANIEALRTLIREAGPRLNLMDEHARTETKYVLALYDNALRDWGTYMNRNRPIVEFEYLLMQAVQSVPPVYQAKVQQHTHRLLRIMENAIEKRKNNVFSTTVTTQPVNTVDDDKINLR